MKLRDVLKESYKKYWINDKGKLITVPSSLDHDEVLHKFLEKSFFGNKDPESTASLRRAWNEVIDKRGWVRMTIARYKDDFGYEASIEYDPKAITSGAVKSLKNVIQNRDIKIVYTEFGMKNTKLTSKKFLNTL